MLRTLGTQRRAEDGEPLVTGWEGGVANPSFWPQMLDVWRWSAILAHAGMHAFAASLLSLPADGLANGEGVLPPLGQLLAQPEAAPTNPSRLPGR